MDPYSGGRFMDSISEYVSIKMPLRYYKTGLPFTKMLSILCFPYALYGVPYSGGRFMEKDDNFYGIRKPHFYGNGRTFLWNPSPPFFPECHRKPATKKSTSYLLVLDACWSP